MLAKFEVTNFKNFNTPVTLNLTQSNKYKFNPECIKNGNVNKALIYGHNGTGKSNLGFAIFDIVRHTTLKNNSSETYNNYLNACSETTYANFKYSFQFSNGSVIYEYGKDENGQLVFEKIIINDSVFASIDRRLDPAATINAQGAKDLRTNFGDSKISLVSYIFSNSLLEENEENSCFNDMVSFINGMLFFRCMEVNNYIGYTNGNEDVGESIIENDNVIDFQGLLNEAGIDCELGVIEQSGRKELAFKFDCKLIPFYEIASQGTKSLSLFYYWYQFLKESTSKVSFLFIDEFDAFYHHSLSALVVKKLKDINAQTILTTHNTSIITNELLRPDCYFLIRDNTLKSLANRTVKELREAHNIEKMYKAGSFYE